MLIKAVRRDGHTVARWDPVKHLRDRHGRFIETGGRVRLLDDTLATVTRPMAGNRVEVHRDDGRTEVSPASTVQVVHPAGAGTVEDVAQRTGTLGLGEKFDHNGHTVSRTLNGYRVKLKSGEAQTFDLPSQAGRAAHAGDLGGTPSAPAAKAPPPAPAAMPLPQRQGLALVPPGKPRQAADGSSRKPVMATPAALGKPAADKALREAIKSGVASRKAPGSAKVTGSQGEQGGVEVVTFNNGAQYIHKDFKGIVVPRPESQGGPRRMSLEEKKLMVAKESLAAKVSDVIGAGAPAILRDPRSAAGFYEPKVAGVSAMEYFNGGKRSPAKMYDSPEGMKIGLLDAVIGSDDRHLGNVMITPDGKPVPIDHNDTWVTGRRLLTRGPFEVALSKRIKAGESPFSVADLDQFEGKIRALKPEFDAMPGGDGARYYQMTMDKLAQIRGQVAGG